jgi:hypothetical protein
MAGKKKLINVAFSEGCFLNVVFAWLDLRPREYADRNRAVANQRLTGSNARWKWTTDYNRRSIAETAMYRVKQLFGGSLTLRDYDGQVAEAMAPVRALNKMTKAGMPESVRIA